MSVTVVDRMARGAIFVGSLAAEEEEQQSGRNDAGLDNECTPSTSTTSTSSIGKNSDDATDAEDCEENEVQSKYKGITTSLDSMESLEEVLPIRRGISKFYNGKSKSFTSLAEASSSCIKEITKPENAYTRKRRNLLAFNLWDKNRSFPRGGAGISKRPISASRSTLALAVAMSSSESISSASDDSNSSSYSKSPPHHLPPLHPRSMASHNNLASLPSQRQDFSPWRSFSLADLQQCAVATSACCDKSHH